MIGAMDFIETLLSTAADHCRKTGGPLVTLSYAQSLDGSISGRPGEALLLSGKQSLILTHKLRAGHDAILVGIGTVLSDDPRLNVRLVDGSNPRPIVVDTHLRIPLDCKLLTQTSESLWIITGENPDQEKRKHVEDLGARVINLPCDEVGLVDLNIMLKRLGESGINSLMVEGGSRIITNFLMKRLANSMILTIAPVLLNGMRGVRHLGSPCSREGVFLCNRGHKKLGQDIILWGNLS